MNEITVKATYSKTDNIWIPKEKERKEKIEIGCMKKDGQCDFYEQSQINPRR